MTNNNETELSSEFIIFNSILLNIKYLKSLHFFFCCKLKENIEFILGYFNYAISYSL